MPSTYSINVGTPYESTRLSNVSDMLNQLPDNASKLISPKDVRDAVYSAWENSAFKQTTGSASIEYIGIDRSDIKQKIFIGKKQLSNVDILNSSLLSPSQDTDIFFFNTKSDSNLSAQNTRASFLAGTNSVLYLNAPYLESQVAVGTSSQVLNFNIVNPSTGGGDINISSSYGRVSLNGIVFPTSAQTIASASSGMVLKYSGSSLYWGNITIDLATIGSTGSSVTIFGDVTLNGNSLEFTDTNPIINPIGDIQIGDTFSHVPLETMIRRILYSYIAPLCSVSTNVSIAEAGNISSSVVNWSITKQTDSIITALFTTGNVTGFAPSLPISTPGTFVVSGSSTGVIPGAIQSGNAGAITYTLQIDDNGFSGGPSTVIDSATISAVYPYFIGATSVDATNNVLVNSILGSLTKKVEEKDDKTYLLSGSGYIYFIYPVSSGGPVYGLLSQILDENGFDVTSAFTYSIYSSPSGVNSPSGYWSNISYYVYKTVLSTSVGLPTPVNWQFKY